VTGSKSLACRSGFRGVLQIVRFNWPFYAIAVLVNLAVAALVWCDVVSGSWSAVALGAAGISDLWLLTSLAVSHYIYDRSGIARSEWLRDLAPETVHATAAFHAGHDEASAALRSRFPDARVAVFDFFDDKKNTEASLLRARALAGDESCAVPVAIDAIPLSTSELDLACVVFAAHEIRRADDRALLFRELARVLKTEGRLIVVEHLRDAWNGFAYGPGVLHFLPRSAWMRTFASSELIVHREARVTPFVTVFELSRSG
jgi:SAM-dependent methyltransferase